MQISLQSFDWPTFFSLVAAIGVVVALWQVRLAAKGIQAQTLMKLIDEWRSKKVYKSISYIHRLRSEWKGRQPDPNQWSNLARRWVDGHAGKKYKLATPYERKKLDKEWMQRRIASQFFG